MLSISKATVPQFSEIARDCTIDQHAICTVVYQVIVYRIRHDVFFYTEDFFFDSPEIM